MCANKTCNYGWQEYIYNTNKYRDQVPKYVIYAGPHKIKDHQYGVTSCNKKRGKLCAHVVVKCANCRGGHPRTSN